MFDLQWFPSLLTLDEIADVRSRDRNDPRPGLASHNQGPINFLAIKLTWPILLREELENYAPKMF